MATKKTTTAKVTPKAKTSKTVKKTTTARRVTDDQIRLRAYEIFIQNGSQPGYDKQNWLQAESELKIK